MAKGIEKSILLVIEAEINQIGICVDGIKAFLKVVKEEGVKR